MTGLLDKIFDRTVTGLTKAMDLTWQRNEAISSNIANAETPQYRAVDVDFANELDRAFDRYQGSVTQTDARHLDLSTAQGGAHLVGDLSGATKGDGNNVDLDLQMGRLAYNGGQYSIASNLMRKHLTFLKNAIRDASR